MLCGCWKSRLSALGSRQKPKTLQNAGSRLAPRAESRTALVRRFGIIRCNFKFREGRAKKMSGVDIYNLVDQFWNFSWDRKCLTLFLITLKFWISDLLGETKEVFSLSNLIQNENDLIFASATSDDHFNFSMDSFHSIRKYYPNHTYILYGLGLSEYYINSLPDNLEFRQFNTSGYPSFVNTWMHYNFKPLILAELLRENPVVWWIDSHLVTIKPNIIRNMYDDISTNRLNSNYSSIVSSVLAFHSNFAVLNTGKLPGFW